MFKKLPRLQNDDAGADAGSGSGGGESTIDMAAAVEEIGNGLGLNKEELANEPTDDPRPPEPTPAPTAAPVSTPIPTAAPATTPTATPAPAGTPPAADITKAPGTWTAAAQSQWGALTPEIRTEIHKREQDMWRGLEVYKGEATFAKGIKTILAPMMPALQQAGVMPEQFVHNLTQSHLILANPQIPAAQKQQLALKLLNDYGIPIPGASAEDPKFVDPEVASLQKEVAELRSFLNGQQQQVATRQRATLKTEIDTFAEDPAHPHFNDVADDIVMLIKGSGGQMSLKDAYERAVRLNPVTFAKEQARIETEAVTKAQKEAAEKAAAARKASSANVSTRGHRGSETTAPGSMDDTMAATLKAIRAKEKA